MLTNARSLSPKIHSLHDCFEEHELQVAMITESWLKDSTILNRDIIDLEYGTNLKIIYRNRPSKTVGARRVGGGVSIVYDKTKCSLRERKIVGNKYELVAAVGKIGKAQRQVAFFCLYIEPKTKAQELEQICDLISNDILDLKASTNPIVFLGGDLNRRSLNAAVQAFPDIVQVNNEPTRRTACLDILMSDAPDISAAVWPPLATPDGVLSDHSCVIFSGSIATERSFTWVKRTTRKHTDKAVEAFGRAMAATDWDQVLPPLLDPDDLVGRFEKYTGDLIDQLFPLKTVKVRSNESPWITHGIRRLGRYKRGVYKREGKSDYWCSLRDRLLQKIEESKSIYVERASQCGQSTRSYFSAVKDLSTKERPPDWSVLDLFPGESEKEAGDKTAAFFTTISDQFPPLVELDPPPHFRQPVTLEQVQQMLRKAKKPGSMVKGDILPRLVKKHHNLLALPAMTIFNSVFRSNKWPTAWKTETTVVIPKSGSPDSLSGCRNISCTPFLSKVLEMFLLEDLRAELTKDPVQYGGLKGVSVNHLLVDLYEEVLGGLDKGKAATILGVDFEKAFNRLNHHECLAQLARLGASSTSLNLVRAFLTNRSMRVKIGSTLSDRRFLKGGSPQGSILGCLLYCAATQHLGTAAGRGAAQHVTPLTPPAGMATVSPTPPGSDPPSMNVLDWASGGLITSSPSTDDSFYSAIGSPASPTPVSPEVLYTNDKVTFFKYVDDTTLVEVTGRQATRHISGTNPTETLSGGQCDDVMLSLIQGAEDMGMRINCAKTQAVCIAPSTGYNTTAVIRAGTATITSTDSVKLLGFIIDNKGGVAGQVELIKDKFRRRFWSLIHLRKAGIKGHHLFRLYTVLVRPILESNGVVFHPMLTQGQSNDLEKLQKHVIRLCFGRFECYRTILAALAIPSLQSRRLVAIRKFVAKTITRDDAFARKWFVRRQEVGTALRRRRPYIENKARTERYLKSPLLCLQKIANDLSTE